MALNTDRLPATDDGRFFRNLMRQWPQGLWVVTPEGKTLGFHYHKPTPGATYKQNQTNWVAGTVEMLESAAKAAGPLPPRAARAGNPFPDRGIGVNKVGGVRLAVSVIGLRGGRQDGPPAVDSALLTRDEWATFAQPGEADWKLPEAVAKKFAPALSPVTDSIFVPRPADVTKAVVAATVVREADGLWVIRYAGEWESFHLRDGDDRFPVRSAASGTGNGVYDPKTKSLRSLVWVLKGTYRNGPTAAPVPTAAVVEWEFEDLTR